MFSRFLSLLGVVGLLLCYRYMLKLGKPRTDWWYLEEYTARLFRRLRIGGGMLRAWLIGLFHYAPSKSVEDAWRTLRARYQTGAYNGSGT